MQEASTSGSGIRLSKGLPPASGRPVERLMPLPGVLASGLGDSPAPKKGLDRYFHLLAAPGGEF